MPPEGPLGGIDHVYSWTREMDRAVTFYGEALTLYRSQLRREGARYEPLARLPLREWSSRPPGDGGPV